MAHFTFKKCETPHAITIDIVDEGNNIQTNHQGNASLNITWVWGGLKDKKTEKKRLMEEIKPDLIYVKDTFGCAMTNRIIRVLIQKIDEMYLDVK